MVVVACRRAGSAGSDPDGRRFASILDVRLSSGQVPHGISRAAIDGTVRQPAAGRVLVIAR